MPSCKYCDRVFPTREQRVQHLRQKHSCACKFNREVAMVALRSKLNNADERRKNIEEDQLQPEDMGEAYGTAMEGVEMQTGVGVDAGREDHLEGRTGTPLFEAYLSAATDHAQPAANQEMSQNSGPVVDVPHSAPVVVEYFPNENAGRPIRFEELVDPQDRVTGCLANDANFEMADFINSVDMTSSQRDTFFKLQLNQHLPWKNDRQFMKDIDECLPDEPEMKSYKVTVGEGQEAETVEMYAKNLLEVVRRMLGDPRFKQYMHYVPQRHYADEARKVRLHGQTYAGNFMWRMQCLIKDEHGTVITLILMSDKTQLTILSGGKVAWPVYATIGNISKEVRRQPSKHATVLLGYLPVPSKPTGDSNDKQFRERAWETFHKCMSVMLEPIREASREGVEILCSDGGVRRCYPLLASYVADYPEQCLVACASRCPVCEQETKGMGDIGSSAPMRTKWTTLRALEEYEVGMKSAAKKLGLRPVWPFWTNLPHINLSSAITPDLLHQLHKGMFLDHLVAWCQVLMTEEEMDRRFKAMTRYHGVRHFKNGISSVSQWTGREAKEMSRVFLAVIDGAVPPKAVRAARALLDFMFLAHSSSLTDIELQELDQHLATFHENKNVFKFTLDKKKEQKPVVFDMIRKVHMLRHYTYMIRELGTPDGYNSEAPERLHIDLAKVPYRASNKVEPLAQMSKFVQRKEGIARRRHYLQENGRLHLRLNRVRSIEDRDHGDYEDGAEGEGEVSDEGEVEGMSGRDDTIDNNRDLIAIGPVIGSVEGARREIRPIHSNWRNPGKPFDPVPHLHTSRRSTWPQKTGAQLIDRHEASDLIDAVNEFLDKLPLHSRAQSLHPRVGESDHFPCWSRCTVRHPRLPFKPTEPAKSSVLRAAPASHKDGALTRPAAFDTVLLLCYPQEIGLSRYRAARVRAIFELPSRVRPLYPHKLIYIELFTRFSLPSSSSSGLYRTSHAFRNGKRDAAVVPLDAVRMCCHLVPVFNSIIPQQPLTSKVDFLDVCKQFFFNSYADYFLFEIMRHWQRCVNSRARS